MKTTLLLMLFLAVPAMGQALPEKSAQKDTSAERALKSLEGLQTARAILKDKATLARLRAEAEQPNYGGNAAAKTRNNLWLSILQGKAKPAPNPPAKPND